MEDSAVCVSCVVGSAVRGRQHGAHATARGTRSSQIGVRQPGVSSRQLRQPGHQAGNVPDFPNVADVLYRVFCTGHHVVQVCRAVTRRYRADSCFCQSTRSPCQSAVKYRPDDVRRWSWLRISNIDTRITSRFGPSSRLLHSAAAPTTSTPSPGFFIRLSGTWYQGVKIHCTIYGVYTILCIFHPPLASSRYHISTPREARARAIAFLQSV